MANSGDLNSKSINLYKVLLFPTRHNHRVLYYHVISNEHLSYYPLKQLFTSNDMKEQIKWLLGLGYKFISLSEAIEAVRTGTKLTKTISLTFDDNFSCLYDNLMPLILRFNLKPTLFITTKTLDNQALAWNHKFLQMQSTAKSSRFQEEVYKTIGSFGGRVLPSALISTTIQTVDMLHKDDFADAMWSAVMPFSQKLFLATNKPFLSNKQLTEMLAEGCELGSHSHTHPDFSKLSYEESYDELQLSFNELQRFPLSKTRLFAYPYGKRCAPEIEAKLAQELEIDNLLGIRFSLKDNKSDNHHWERELMELGRKNETTDFAIRPLLRYLKDISKKHL